MYFVDSAGQNKQHSAHKNTAKLDRETDELHHDTIGLDVGRLIQQYRQKKEFSQKDLATVRIVIYLVLFRHVKCSYLIDPDL